ncbi:nucleotidyltransferase family protein [Phaeovulum sp. W22_SRMD_FR3]|uniref:nucleotidyltransferase family protein n=1 Tax=Phaeovulum sp. W22_SRMD_FR3 TaxID=3240274 RepID=UPI003F9D8489
MSLIAVLLAGGRSTRFGAEDKLQALIDGMPMLSRSAQTLTASGADHCFAVLRDQAQAALLPESVTPVFCQGQQSDSLRTGLDAARAAGATRLLIALADMPFVTPDLLRKVVAACGPDHAACAAGASGPQAPACFPARWFDALNLLQGDRGAGTLLHQDPGVRIVAAVAAELQDIDLRKQVYSTAQPTPDNR